ncbi:uncharacterized protein ARMOST_12199 [Armillaria ostoyae]|uniref:Uncharacterized protein n=1 Tax=Armillaria ostoyae TaxID=47428 RepID=A0A284RJ88_ARMOS|nr:uncharacterized protein ARMOST_12199 [Armillaria ostoyae]
MSAVPPRYLLFVCSLLGTTPTATNTSSTVIPATLSPGDSSPVIFHRGGQRLAVPKLILQDPVNLAVLELRFDQIVQSSYKTKGLKGHKGAIVYIPLKYWPSLLPYITSVELDVRKGSHPFIGLFVLLIVAILWFPSRMSTFSFVFFTSLVPCRRNGFPIMHLPLHLFQLVVEIMYRICLLVVHWLANGIAAVRLL